MNIKKFFYTIQKRAIFFFIVLLPISVYALPPSSGICAPSVAETISVSATVAKGVLLLGFIAGLILFPFLISFFEKRNNINRSKIRFGFKFIHVFFISFLVYLILFTASSLSNVFISLIEADKLFSNLEGELLGLLFFILTIFFYVALTIGGAYIIFIKTFPLFREWRKIIIYTVLSLPILFVLLGIFSIFVNYVFANSIPPVNVGYCIKIADLVGDLWKKELIKAIISLGFLFLTVMASRVFLKRYEERYNIPQNSSKN